MISTVYIAGKITGDPNYKEKFNAAQKKLEALGYIVLNPAWFPSEGFTYEAYLRMSKAMLIECEAVCMLPDWMDSDGAYCELILAKRLGKTLYDYNDMKDIIVITKSGMLGAETEK